MNTCKNLILLTVIFLFISSFFSCKKEELKIMMVRNDSISDVSYRTAKAYATIIDPGEGIEQHGHCWSTNAESITIDTENKTDNGAKKSAGTYSSTLTNLSPGESYYVRAYVKKGKTVIYGDDVLPFTTLSIGMPEVITGTVKSITTSGATVSANLNSFGAGASSVKQHGHCCSSETTTPTVENSNVSNLGSTDSIGIYESKLVNLSENTLYYVRAYAINDAGTVYGDTISFKTREPLKAEFDANPKSGYLPLSIQFTDMSTGDIKSWSWNFGDGGTSTNQNPSHQYDTPGNYTVVLTVSNSYSTDSETKNNYITVNASGSAPIASFTADKTSITEGEYVSFTDQSVNVPTTWSWNFGDGGTSTNQNPTHQYNTPGNYTVILTVNNSHGTDSETKNNYITVNAGGSAPVANFTADKTSITEGETVNFTDHSTNDPTSWSWNFGDGGTSTNQNPAHQYDTPGIYTVILTVSNSYGTDSETKNDYINVINIISWQKSLGGSNDDRACSVQQTTDGGYIIAGESTSNDGDVSGNHGAFDYWIVKLISTGSIAWKKSYGGSSEDMEPEIEQTADAGYIIAGTTRSDDGDVSGDPGGSDYWIVRLISEGKFDWQKPLGGTGTDRGYSITQTTDGDYIIAGYSTSDDGDVTGNHGSSDYWIVKLTSAGNIDWQKSLGGSGTDRAYSIKQTNDGGYIIAGYSNSNDGDVTGNHGGTDYWIVKLTSAGNIDWQKSLGGSGTDKAYSIQQTTDGGYIIAGSSNSNDGDVSGNHGGYDYWIVKLTSTGDIEWQKSRGGSNDDYAKSIQQTNDGGYIVAGDAESNDGNVTGNHGGNDYWIVKLTSAGNIDWQKSFGGSGADRALSIQQTADEGYIIAGYSDSNDGDVTGNHGGSDYWIVKIY